MEEWYLYFCNLIHIGKSRKYLNNSDPVPNAIQTANNSQHYIVV